MRTPRILTLVVSLILAGLLLATVSPAGAFALPSAVIPFALEEEEIELEEEAEGNSEEECAEATAEFAEAELSEDELGEICEADEEESAGTAPPEECLLRTLSSRATYTSRGRVQLTLRYTTYESTTATIEYGLAGGKGSLHLGTAKRQLGQMGILRFGENLDDAAMTKVEAAHQFTVQVHVPAAPSRCGRYYSQQLRAKHLPRGRIDFEPRRHG